MSVAGGKAEVPSVCLRLPFVAITGHSSAPWSFKIRPSGGCGMDAVLLAVERWYGFPEFGVIWEMSVQIPFLEMGLHLVVSHAPPLMSTRKNRIPVNGAQN